MKMVKINIPNIFIRLQNLKWKLRFYKIRILYAIKK